MLTQTSKTIQGRKQKMKKMTSYNNTPVNILFLKDRQNQIFHTTWHFGKWLSTGKKIKDEEMTKKKRKKQLSFRDQ